MPKKSHLPRLTEDLHESLDVWVDSLAENRMAEDREEKRPEKDLDQVRVEVVLELLNGALEDGGVHRMIEDGTLDDEDFGEDAEHEWTTEQVIGSLKLLGITAIENR